MKNFLTTLSLLLTCLPSMAQVYLYNPTNNPGLQGQQMFSSGTFGYYYWGWGTNAQSSNATVVVASPSVAVDTNGFAYTVRLTTGMTNFFGTFTNEVIRRTTESTNYTVTATNSLAGYARTLSAADTNEVTRQTTLGTNYTITATNDLASYARTLSANDTNNDQVIVAGSGTVIVTNGRLRTVYGKYVPGSNVTMTTNVDDTVTVTSTGGGGGNSTNAVVAGVDILVSTNGAQYTVNLNTNMTNITSISGVTGTGLTVTENNMTNGLMFVFNVWDFGAIPNDGSSDLTAIRAALVAAGTNGGTVFIPPGNYELGGAAGPALIVPNNVTLMGSHAPNSGAGSRLNFTGSGAAIQFADGAKMAIRHLFLNGNNTVDSLGISTTNTADLVNQTTHFVVEDVRAFGFKTGFWLHNAWVWEFNTCYADNGTDGLVISNTAASGKITGGEYAQNTNNIYLRGGEIDGIEIRTTMESGRVGIRMSDENNGYNKNIQIFDSYFEGNTNALIATNCQGLVFQGNYSLSDGTNVIMDGINTSVIIKGNLFGGGQSMNIGATTYTSEIGPNELTHADSGGKNSALYGIGIGTNITAHPSSAFIGSGYGLTNLNYNTALTNLPQTSVLGRDASGGNAIALTVGTGLSAAGGILSATGSGSATNAIANVAGTNVTTGTGLTNLDFWPTPGSLNIGWWQTNRAGHMDIVPFLKDTLTNNTSGTASGATNDATGTLLLTRFQQATNEVTRQVALSTNGGFSLNQIARSNIVDQIQTWPTATNQLIAIPGSTSWLIQSATPTAQTNISGTLSASQWIFQSLTVSNNTAAAFTNWITIPAAKAVGYSATNSVAVLGFNGCVVPASSYVELLYKFRLGQTNFAIINP